MLIGDVMTTNVITAPSNMSVYEARKIMDAHGIRRLPVVDKGKLVGVVSMGRLESITPPKGTSVSIWELNYLLAKTTLREIMEKNMVTATPDMTVEEGLSLAQGNKVGALLVVQDGNVVGIATTNDFFYKIVNPILGLGKPGVRLFIPGAGEGKGLEDVISVINRRKVRIITLFPLMRDDGKPNDLIVHLESEDASEIILDLKDRNYLPIVRRR
ncbi:MAG: CBS domain-containing protein [Dehalococcoidia bacterium]|nr:CBS domain-containing protein [Dehalococcoidia bacterium]MDZ4245654.1 CBS domain-containing protein [Dehalococcoidia bacterium]